MKRNKMLIISAISVLFVAGIVQFLSPRTVVSPTQTAPQLPVVEVNEPSQFDLKSLTVTTASNPTKSKMAIASGDVVASWDFVGAYAGNPELVAKAESEIARLSNLLKTATSSAMILSVNIANQYEFLGYGKKQYEYLGRAIQAWRGQSGLPWHNLGVLMERLGALKTARVAYEEATIIQPQLEVYQYAYISFLINNMKDDAVSIEKAFTTAEKNIGKAQYLSDLRTEWQKP